MLRSRGDTMSRTLASLLLALTIAAQCRAGPLGPLPNVTSADVGLKEGSCALGDVVYMPGDEFPGSGPCERCTCSGGGVQCTRQTCEPRPGCKALHRPDHCCPTYQCECEQEGRVYGNGEKLVDPADPCRVCYCQGGEVVCRRIACFVRDDCTPRLVPGRCCPEYDNCPLRGVTSLPGVTSSIPSISTSESIESRPAPPKENIKQEITIKEITPVSEIPVITDVKIKEILPSPSIEVAEYSSSKSPLIPREATSEKVEKDDSKTESPSVIEVHSSLPVIVSSVDATQFTDAENKDVDAPPSKISFSTQDSIHSAIYPSNIPIVATMGIPPATPDPFPVVTTKAPIIEEEDTFDHNPAFPPLPDDLAVLRNHEDEIVPEQVVDNDHVSSHDIVVASISPVTEAEVKEPLTTTSKDLPDTTTVTTTEKPKLVTEFTTLSTEAPTFKESPMVSLRSAIPTEIFNSPSLVPEEVTGELDETTTADYSTTQAPRVTTDATGKLEELIIGKAAISTEDTIISGEITTSVPESAITSVTTLKPNVEIELEPSTKDQEQTTSSIARSNVATEVTSQTELSSLPIETSDQNPPEVPENTTHDKDPSATTDSLEISSKVPVTSSEVIAVSRAASNENTGYENVETTEFIVTSFASSETSTDNVELIKISADPEKPSAAIIESADGKTTNDQADLTTDVKIKEILPSTSIAVEEYTSTKSPLIAREATTGNENVETTETTEKSFGSSETSTDSVELIKTPTDTEKPSAAIIERAGGKNTNDFSELIQIVKDVASISDQTDQEDASQQLATPASLSNSEELIPVNSGYKSKNKNFNQNSITEIPLKSKISTKPKVEIEDDESESVTDSPPPFDKVEPTTRRPIIDNVSDDVNIAGNKTDKKDIEIITQSYVPTINHKRPTKVIRKSNEKSTSDESLSLSASVETATDMSASNETLSVSNENERVIEPVGGTSVKDSATVTATAFTTSEAATTAPPTSEPSTVTPAATAGDFSTLTTTIAPAVEFKATTTPAPASDLSASPTASPASAQ
ncbi:unnamed protein product [Chrysodeixis includens]|uniref:VWFC domain-containing protein n=1 Tax=Chrysodeixis includens TaxID=689277 RepID=A0A9P0C011_CHRIL|nr:unnamed protein product [Chrysodeixis includens]